MHPYGYFATILYDEQDQSSYEGIQISDRDSGFEKVFSNELKCPVIDHIHLTQFLAEQEVGCRWSSSYDHFFMDGILYEEKYVSCKGSDDPDDYGFVEWETGYDFKVLSKPEFRTFQDMRKYYREWKEKQNFHI